MVVYFFELVIWGRYLVYFNNAGSIQNFLKSPFGTAFKVYNIFYLISSLVGANFHLLKLFCE